MKTFRSERFQEIYEKDFITINCQIGVYKVIYSDGIRWYSDGVCHKVGGPAVIRNNGEMRWLVLGKLHRTDGPAIITKDKRKWFLNGIEYKFKDYFEKLSDKMVEGFILNADNFE